MTDQYLTDRESGPAYNVESAALKKFRRLAAKGLHTLSAEDRRAYGEAVENALRTKAPALAAVPQHKPNCASGTYHNTGEAIHKAMQAKQRAALSACPSQERIARKPHVWQQMYEDAMAEKAKAGKASRAKLAA